MIIEFCTCNKTDDEIENRLEKDVEDYVIRGLRALAVAYEEIDNDNFEAEGNGFELIGLPAIYDPHREDTKQTVDDALALGIRVKMGEINLRSPKRPVVVLDLETICALLKC